MAHVYKMSFKQVMNKYKVPDEYLQNCPQCGKKKFFTGKYYRLNCKISAGTYLKTVCRDCATSGGNSCQKK